MRTVKLPVQAIKKSFSGSNAADGSAVIELSTASVPFAVVACGISSLLASSVRAAGELVSRSSSLESISISRFSDPFVLGRLLGGAREEKILIALSIVASVAVNTLFTVRIIGLVRNVSFSRL